MVVFIKIEKSEMMYDCGTELFSTIYINGKFYKQIGGVSSLSDMIEIIKQQRFKP
jgi:hypothetical protein